jgi:hypothetical protein
VAKVRQVPRFKKEIFRSMIETDVEKVPRRAWLLRSQNNKCVVQFFTGTIQTTPTKHTTGDQAKPRNPTNQPSNQPCFIQLSEKQLGWVPTHIPRA